MDIRINDIENENLTGLIKQRTIEYRGVNYLNGCLSRNEPITGCFLFNETKEGSDFWWSVYEGEITEL